MKRVDFTTRQREYWQNYLLARDGYYCVCCKKDTTTLIRESKIDRKLPVLVIDHIDGDTRYTDSKDGVIGGNLRHLCYSCNRKNIKETRPVEPERPRTPEQKKSEDSKPIFYNFVNAYLVENKNICYKRMLNRGSKLANDSSQITVTRWYDQLVDVVNGYEEYPLSLVDGDCDYSKCNGIHVCFYGEIPREEDVAKQQALREGIADYDDADKYT